MKYVYGKRVKTLRERLTSGLASLVLLANTVGMSLPFILAQRAAAAPYVSTVTTGFNVLTNWEDDRAAPSGGFTLTDSVLTLGVDGDAPDSKASNAFYRTEGRKATLPAGTNSIKATLHVDSAWASVIGVRAGLWGVTSDTPAYYPILEFSNRNDGDDQLSGPAVIRAWNSDTNSWTNIITNPVYGTDYIFEIVHNPHTGTFEYYVNNSPTPVMTATGTANSFSSVIFNSYNSGIANNDYTVKWSNFETGIKLPEPSVLNQAFVPHNESDYAGVLVEFEVSDFTNATDAYVTIERASGGDVVKKMNPAKLGEYVNDGAARTLTVPFPIIERTYTEAGSSSWIPMTNNNWNSATVPTFAYATVVTPEGNITNTKLPFSGTYNASLLATPSTNEANKAKGWAHVNELNKNIGSVELEFVSERNFFSCFEYRTDGDTSQIIEANNSNTEITDGKYPYYCLNNEAQVHTISANEYVEVRMVFGAEKDERFDWTRFDVLSDYDAPEVSGVVLNGKNVNIARDVNCGSTEFNLVSGKINLSATITDNASGVKSAVYKIRKVTDGGCTQTGIYQSGTVSMNNQVGDTWVTLSGSELDTAGVPADGNYTIMLTVSDNAGNSSTKYIDITVDNTAPAQPQILGIYKGHNNNTDNLLSCGGVTNSTQIRIDWDDVDGAEYYWFGTKLNPKHKKVTVSHYNGNMTPGNNPYFYTVIAVDAAGNESPISAQCNLTLDQESPDAFNVSPADNSVVNGASITQTWGSNASDVAYYIYESYHDAGASSLRWREEITDTSKTATNVADTTYWWRVKSVDYAGNESAWSELWKLTVNNAVSPVLTANYFTVHEDSLGVGFNIDGFDDATKVEVKIYDADNNLIASNTGDSTDMLNLLNSHSGEISSPFYIPFQDPTDGYWNFGNADWEDVLPAYAVITIHYGSGEEVSDSVDFVPINQDNNQFTYQALIAGLGGNVQGVSTDTPNSTGGRNIANGLTDGDPRVLGANSDVLSSTGTQNVGLIVLLASSFIVIALAAFRRKQHN